MVTLTPSCRRGWPRRSHVPILLCSKQQRYTELFAKRWCVFLAQETGGDQIQMQQPFSHNSSSIIYRTWWILLHNLCSVLLELLDVPPFLSVWSQIRLATSISGKVRGKHSSSLRGSAPLFCPSSRHCAHLEPQKQPMPAWLQHDQHDPQRICQETLSVKAAKGQQWRRPSTRRKNSGHRNHRSVAWQNHGNIELK